MTPEEYSKKYRSGVGSAVRAGGWTKGAEAAEAEFDACFTALVDRVRAEARREALIEAENTILARESSLLSREQGAGPHLRQALHALPRWDGRTAFVPEKIKY